MNFYSGETSASVSRAADMISFFCEWKNTILTGLWVNGFCVTASGRGRRWCYSILNCFVLERRRDTSIINDALLSGHFYHLQCIPLPLPLDATSEPNFQQNFLSHFSSSSICTNEKSRGCEKWDCSSRRGDVKFVNCRYSKEQLWAYAAEYFIQFETKMPITIHPPSLEGRVNLFSQLSRQEISFLVKRTPQRGERKTCFDFSSDSFLSHQIANRAKRLQTNRWRRSANSKTRPL